MEALYKNFFLKKQELILVEWVKEENERR